MSQKSRTYNSIFNSIVGIISAVLNVALNFAVRIVIVHTLGEEINGLHSLFQNITNIMAVVEASMCTAMIIHLYEPIKRNDVQELNGILNFYNKVYIVLASGFLVVGGILNAFLDCLISTDIPVHEVHLYFFLFTLSLAVSYLTYTYRVVLFASQKNRISSMATLAAEIVFRGGAAVTAVLFQNYAIFLLCFIGEKLFGNLLCRLYVKKTYKGITCKLKNESDKQIRTKVMETVKPLLISRIADIVQNSSQSILISVLLGNIAIVGYYGNYTLVVGSVGLLFSQMGAAFTSSFGSLATENDNERMYHAFRKTEFILSSVSIVICSGFLACIQDFITLVFGTQFLLGNIAVLILAGTMFVTLLNIPCISVQNAIGCHRIDIRNMVIQAICSIVGGYLGGILFGMEGILLGMLIPLMIFTTLGKNIIVQKKVFGKRCIHTLNQLILTLLKGTVIFCVVIVITSFIDMGSELLNIVLKGLAAVILAVSMIGIISCRNPYFKSTVRLIRDIVTSRRRAVG